MPIIEFDEARLTAAINTMPIVPKQLGALGWFSVESVDTTSVEIERQEEAAFGVVAAVPRGSPGESTGRSSRDGEIFKLAHVPLHDTLWAEEAQNQRSFGTDGELTRLDVELAKLQMRHKNRLAATIESMRIGALKGIVLNKDGKEIVNFWTKFGLEPNEVSLNLVSGKGLRSTFDLWRDKICDELGDEEPVAYESLIGEDAFRAMISHGEAREEYLAQVKAGTAQAGAALGDTFDYGGIRWRKAAARGKQSSTVDRVEPNKAYIVPMGVPDLLIGRFGPSTWIDGVNTMGLPLYAKAKINHEETGYDVWSQTNPFFAPTRPRAILQATFNLA